MGGAVLLALSAHIHPAPRLIWNPSPSVAVGLYWRSGTSIARGDLVLATAPDTARAFAASRKYIPVDVPLIKRIAAVDGDEICVRDNNIFINGHFAARQLLTDSQGRPMPLWKGCRALVDEVFLLLDDVPTSFDSRYFGPIPRSGVRGKVTPLWTHIEGNRTP